MDYDDPFYFARQTLQCYPDEDLSKILREHPDYMPYAHIFQLLGCDRRDLKKRCRAIGKPLRLRHGYGLTKLQIDICLEAQRCWQGARYQRQDYDEDGPRTGRSRRGRRGKGR